MTDKRGRPGGSDGAGRADWRELLPAIGTTALVLGVLGLTSVLHVPVENDGAVVAAAPAPERAGTSSDLAPGDEDRTPDPTTRDPTPAPRVGGEAPTAVGPGERSAVDRGRLGRRGDAWTVQILAACDPENVRALTERLGTDERLYVLPAEIGGRPCFRVCWGTYATPDAARRAPGLPADLRATLGALTPKEVSTVLR